MKEHFYNLGIEDKAKIDMYWRQARSLIQIGSYSFLGYKLRGLPEEMSQAAYRAGSRRVNRYLLSRKIPTVQTMQRSNCVQLLDASRRIEKTAIAKDLLEMEIYWVLNEIEMNLKQKKCL